MRNRDLAIAVVVIVVVLLLLGLFVGGGMGFGGMGQGLMGGYYGMGNSALGGVIMVLFWLLAVGGIVLLVVWLARQVSFTPTGSTGQESTPLEILKRRYARGDITKEQFEQMRHDL